MLALFFKFPLGNGDHDWFVIVLISHTNVRGRPLSKQAQISDFPNIISFKKTNFEFLEEFQPHFLVHVGENTHRRKPTVTQQPIELISASSHADKDHNLIKICVQQLKSFNFRFFLFSANFT